MSPIEFQELTIKTWHLFERLMGEKGGCAGCWCMLYRSTTSEFQENKYEGNRKAMRKLVEAGQPIGLIALIDTEPIGWISLAPRQHLPKIDHSRALKKLDKKPAWSISCFFVAKEYRNQGISTEMIKGAIRFARQQKIKTLEAYPTIPYAKKIPAAFLWSGPLSAFKKNGFQVVLKSGKTKAIAQLDLSGQRRD
jgi:GNAT superfamily N-acetyltransferase